MGCRYPNLPRRNHPRCIPYRLRRTETVIVVAAPTGIAFVAPTPITAVANCQSRHRINRRLLLLRLARPAYPKPPRSFLCLPGDGQAPDLGRLL
ncbi:hypothetical protein KSP40_PGU015970 [Platanthera guangdongensis]|uniref:Uncharacterized protein n=1 Tax=Platanthera guangdongensis TaxID=2320717 RepID=A0ABR2M938_9ASPA